MGLQIGKKSQGLVSKGLASCILGWIFLLDIVPGSIGTEKAQCDRPRC